MMKRNAARILAAFGLSAILAVGSVSWAWADTAVVIVPLEESQAQGGQSASNQPASSQSPAGQTGPVASGGGGQSESPSSSDSERATQVQSGSSPSQSENAQSQETVQSAVTVQEPEVAAQGASLYNATTGQFLYIKNGDTQYYPASITKLMTALLVAENCDLSDIVTFSSTATTNLEAGAVSLNLTEGDQLTVEQCLYALLLKSANEVGNALAEHVAGSNQAFADMMNAKAASLGCTNTHFNNPHGLNDPNHYTTAHDMALIAQAAFQNDTVRKVASTVSYTLPATKNNSARTITMGHKMLNPDSSNYYPGIIGGKTGYTSKAGNTLVTAVEKDGVRLIAVILKSSSTHYTDTKALLDYGFELVKQQGSAAQTGTSSGTASGTSSSVSGPGTSIQTGWKEDETGWYYVKSNGAKASGEWLQIEGEDYYFDDNAYMATGWRNFTDGSWYYFHSTGAMAKNVWVEDNDKWFYLGSSGAMLTNTTTPDGYQVDESGAWVS